MKKINFALALAFLFNFFIFQGCNSQSQEQEIKNVESSEQTLAFSESSESQSEQLDRMNESVTNSRRNAITSAVSKVNPAIVGINITQTQRYIERNPFFDDPFFSRFFGRSGRGRVREYDVHSVGSGFIISKDGYILTNHHVAGNASKIIITMTDGKEYEAEIIGSDMVSDVALLKIEGNNFPYLELGNSDDVIIGEWVLAFGNPFGLFDKNAKPTVTIGIVSNAGINFVESDQPYNRVYREMIQTDAAISSGNSGGPLVNALGEVIGMNTMIWSTANSNAGSGSIGIGFAIPINRVKEIVNILKKDNKIERDFFTGMEIKAIDDQIAEYLKIDKKDGVIVYSMKRNSPAEDAGFEPGDIIVSIDDYKIIRDEDYYIVINDAITGETLNFEIIRDGKKKNLKLKLRPYNERRF